LGDDPFSRAAVLPHDDHDKPEKHGVDDPYDRDDETDHLVVLALRQAGHRCRIPHWTSITSPGRTIISRTPMSHTGDARTAWATATSRELGYHPVRRLRRRPARLP
jgi:hypothetical protein